MIPAPCKIGPEMCFTSNGFHFIWKTQHIFEHADSSILHICASQTYNQVGIFKIQHAGASTWLFLIFTPVFNTRSLYALWGSWPTPMKAKLQNANLKSFVVRESQFRLFSIKFREKAVWQGALGFALIYWLTLLLIELTMIARRVHAKVRVPNGASDHVPCLLLIC